MPRTSNRPKSASRIGIALSWLRERFSGSHDPERVFGEEGLLSQVESTPVCPLTGKGAHELPDGEACCLQDGSCSVWAEKDFKVKCLRMPDGPAGATEPPKA